MREPRDVYTVSQVNAYIKNMFTQDYMLQTVFVRGEVGGCKYHSSGHIYFTLKDEKGVISCVMFAGQRGGLGFRLAEGQQVIVGGSVDVYERDGRYQLYARRITLDGAGLLYERFEQLRRELEELGMFDPQYKRPIPRYIRTLGVVTADTGAAVRDIIQITARRNPYVQIILYPAIVQGEQAPESIAAGIRALERQGVDVMIVGRGGGSLEDLWAFNDRRVAQAVFDCSVPIISAVGHETDTTITDFVADLRAPTPSAAAELAVYDVWQLTGTLEDVEGQLLKAMRRRLARARERTGQYEKNLRYLSPGGRIRDRRTRLLNLEESLQQLMGEKLEQRRSRLVLYAEKMKGLSPLGRLTGGYSYAEDLSGRNIRSVRGVEPGDRLVLQVSDGSILARVLETREGFLRDFGEEGGSK